MSAIRTLDDFSAERVARLRRLAELYQKMYEGVHPRPEWVGTLAALAEEQAMAILARSEARGNGSPAALPSNFE